MKNKSVDITGFPIRPVPQELHQTAVCTNCQRNAARWEFAEGARTAYTFACSLCLLYEALKEQRLQVEHMTEQVEKKIATVFPRDETGRLRSTNDADRIAFGIVMAQRFMLAKSRAGGFEGGFRSEN